jgi:hypothetical protein
MYKFVPRHTGTSTLIPNFFLNPVFPKTNEHAREDKHAWILYLSLV